MSVSSSAPPHSTVLTPEDRWLQCIEEWYPQRHSQTYFLPPLHFRKTHHEVVSVPGVPFPVLQPVPRASGASAGPPLYPPTPLTQPPLPVAGSVFSLPKGASAPLPRYQDSDFVDDEAAERVLGCLRELSKDKAEVMLVISQLEFRQYLDGFVDPIEAAYCASLPRPSDLKPPSDDGDFDVLVIHRLYGLMVLEVKAVGTHRVNASDFQRAVKKKVRQAIGQLDKAEGVLRHLLSDRPSTSGVRIAKTLVLPNVTSGEILQAVGSDAKLENDLCACLGTCDLTAAVERCLCKEKFSSVSHLSSGVSQPILPSSIVSQPSPPSSGVSQPSQPSSGVSQPSSPSSGVSQPSPPSSGVSQPNQPSCGVSQPSPPSSGVSQPNPPSSGVNQPIPPSSGVSQPSQPSSGVSQPSSPSSGVSQPSPPSSGVSQPNQPSCGVSQPSPPSSGVSQPNPPSSGVNQPIPPSSGVSQPIPPSSGVSQPIPPSSGVSQPSPPSGGVSQLSHSSSGVSQPSPPSSSVSQLSPPSSSVSKPCPPSMSWWQLMTSQSAGPCPAMSDTVYDLLLARFCGPATSVEVTTVTASHRAVKTGKGKKGKAFPATKVLRTEGDGVAETGLILSTLALYPDQILVLSDPSLRFLNLHGPPGTGKTVMVVVKAIQELHQCHNVLVLSTEKDGRLVSILIEAQLHHALGPYPPPSMGTVYRRDVEDFAKPEDMMALASAAGHLFVIADEIPMHGAGCDSSLGKFIELAGSSWPGLSLWCTGPTSLFDPLPRGMVERALTVPLRTPPAVTRLAQTAIGHSFGIDIMPTYTSLPAQATTDGASVRWLGHSRGLRGHSEEDSVECEECTQNIVLLLKELGIGISTGADALHYRDVVILGLYGDVATWEDLRLALAAHGIPSQILDDTETSQQDVALALTDTVTLADQDNVIGLERRVVIVLMDEVIDLTSSEREDESDQRAARDENFRFYWKSVSRCTGQLVVIRPT